MPSKQDIAIIRELATSVAEIAALPVQGETIGLWKALNGLKPVRPMVMIDQVPWHEMDVEGELALQCEDEFCRAVEMQLRRTLYAWKHMRGDMVVEPVVEIPKAISESFRSGNLGIMDFYRMKNIQSDTTMRNSIGGDLKEDKPGSK